MFDLITPEPGKLLGQAVAEYTSEDLDHIGDAALLDEVVEMSRLINALEAQRARRIAEIDRRRAHERDGHITAAAWLRHRCGMASGRAADHVRIARAVNRMPAMRRVFEAGDLDMTRVRMLVHAHGRHPDTFARDEEVLVTAATSLSVADLRTALAYWAQALDHDEALRDGEARRRRRALYQVVMPDGSHHLEIVLDPEGGHTVRTAVATLADPGNLDPHDRRSPTQRRADGLVDIARFYLDHHPDMITRHGHRPHVSVIVDLATLTGDHPGRSETEDGDVLHPETVRRLLCDARITRIVLDPEGVPVDVGRTSRTVTAAQWKALVVRDGGCVEPGCDRPPGWCDVHHRIPWSQGGRTDLDDLELRCRPHHVRRHEGRRHGRPTAPRGP